MALGIWRCGGMAEGWSPGRQLPQRWERLDRLDDIRGGRFRRRPCADFLWRSVSGDVAIWLIDGARIASFHTVGNVWTGWTISGVGDFDGDRRADILWRSDSRRRRDLVNGRPQNRKRSRTRKCVDRVERYPGWEISTETVTPTFCGAAKRAT